MLHKETVDSGTLELLVQLLALPELANFALVGGTNLSLRFGHRKSDDLDLFTNQDFDLESIVLAVLNTFPDTVVRQKKGQTFLSLINNVKVDIILHKYPYLKSVELIDGLRMLAIDDIIPMKLGALSGRGAKKDFTDIALLLDTYSIAEMLELYKRKYQNDDVGYIVHSLYYFEDAEREKDPLFLFPNSWEKVKEKIITAANSYIDSLSR